MSVDSIEAYEVKSFKASVNELCKILYDDSDDYVDYMEKFLEKYSFDKYKSFILEHQDILKEAPLLDLILDKVLPATFASIFMKAIHLYTLVDEYDQELYASDGISKILYSMNENKVSDIQILGCKILSHLALDEAIREAMGEEEGCVRHVVDVLQYFVKDRHIVFHALNTMTNLCYENNINKRSFVEQGLNILDSLMTYHPDDKDIICKITSLMRNIAKVVANMKDERVESFANSLITFLTKYQTHDDIMNNTLWATVNFISGYDKNKSILAKHGIFEHLFGYLKSDHSTHADVVYLVLGLYAKKKIYRDEIRKRSGITLVFKYLESNKEQISVEYPFKFIERMCIGKAERMIMVSECKDGLVLLLCLMSKKIDTHWLQVSTVKIFGRLDRDENQTVSSEIRHLLKENQGISTLVVSMNTYQNSKFLKIKICEILNALFSEGHATNRLQEELKDATPQDNEDNEDFRESDSDSDSDSSSYEESSSSSESSEYYETESSDSESDDMQESEDENSSIDETEKEPVPVEEPVSAPEPIENSQSDIKPTPIEEPVKLVPEELSKPIPEEPLVNSQKESFPLEHVLFRAPDPTSTEEEAPQTELLVVHTLPQSAKDGSTNILKRDKSATKIYSLIRKFTDTDPTNQEGNHEPGDTSKAISTDPDVESDQQVSKTKIRSIFSFWKERECTF